MADDLTELQHEVARLRREVEALKAQDARGTVYLKDADGRSRGVFQLDEEGARLEIWNKEQRVVVSIGETADGAGEVYVASADGQPRAGIKVAAAGGVVSAQNADGRVNALMIGKPEGGTIIVADKEGRPLVEIGAADAGGNIALKQISGAAVAILRGEQSGGELTLFDDQGQGRQIAAEPSSPEKERIAGQAEAL